MCPVCKSDTAHSVGWRAVVGSCVATTLQPNDQLGERSAELLEQVLVFAVTPRMRLVNSRCRPCCDDAGRTRPEEEQDNQAVLRRCGPDTARGGAGQSG